MAAFPGKRNFVYLQCLKNYRESKLRIFLLFRRLFLIFLTIMREIFAMFLTLELFCHPVTFWFYKFTSENVRRIFSTPKTKHTSSARWSNSGHFCPEVCLFWLKSIRDSFRLKKKNPPFIYEKGPFYMSNLIPRSETKIYSEKTPGKFHFLFVLGLRNINLGTQIFFWVKIARRTSS